MNLAQNNWVEKLLIAQVTLNNNASKTTSESPFYANYGKDPNLFIEPRLGLASKEALVRASDPEGCSRQAETTDHEVVDCTREVKV